jgi:hypothetical protein
MWQFRQSTGELQHNGQHVATGYSGHGAGKNNPAMQGVCGVGPIPRGRWTISGPPVDTQAHGPYVLRLVPAPGTRTLGRSGFLMHGDSLSDPGTASRGCIIVSCGVRERVWESGDRELLVSV